MSFMATRHKYRSQIAEKFRTSTGREHVIFTGRGATAIWAALKAFGFVDQPVLIPANTCYIVLWAVILSGNYPILVDIDPNTGMISAETLSACGVERPAAIIPCHLYGLPAPMQEIIQWANAHVAKVIEDAAQAMIDPDSNIGSWGDVSVFSFGDGKIVDVGLRGALLCNEPELATEIKQILASLPMFDDHIESLEQQWLAIYWATHQYEEQNPQIAELYPKLFEMYQAITLYNAPTQSFTSLATRFSEGSLRSDQEYRLKIASVYHPLIDSVFSTLSQNEDQVMWRYPLLVPSEIRDDLFQHLLGRFYDVTRWYPSLQPMARALRPDIQQPSTPYADEFCRQIINLPLNDGADPPQRIIAAITQYRNWKKI